MNLGLEDEALGVHQQVTLTALDLFTSVITPIFSAYPAGLHRLGVHYARARLRISLQAHS